MKLTKGKVENTKLWLQIGISEEQTLKLRGPPVHDKNINKISIVEHVYLKAS